MAWRPSTATVTVVTIAVALVGNLATNSVSVDKEWTWWSTAVWSAVAVLSVVAVGVEIRRQRIGERPVVPGSGPDLHAVADRLAAVVRKQWRDEITRRSLNDPYPLPVGWEPAPAGLVADWADITRLATRGAGWPRVGTATSWAGSADDLAGHDDALVDVWRKVPTGRLVVLGDPGAGKTMLLARFVVDLLGATTRTPGDPVPVLVSIASWNPREKHLRDWLAERLAIDHPALDHEDATGRSLFKALLDENLIFMVLDGLDEVPEALRGLALADINKALAGGQPLLISSRTDAYRAATRPTGGAEITLTGAAGVHLLPLDSDDVLAYLRSSAGGPVGERRWSRVAESVRAGGVLADVLVTPLMATLARTVYNAAPGGAVGGLPHPDRLLTLPDRTSVEQHLFDGFIPAAYRGHATRRSRWRAEDAVKWLRYLAHHLEHDRRGSPNLTWWHLHLRTAPRKPSSTFAIAVCAALAVVAGLAAGALYSAAYSPGVLWHLAPVVITSVVLVFGTVLWLTGRFGAAVASGIVVAISSGLAIDLGGDLLAHQSFTQPTLLIGVGIAAGLVYPLRPDPPTTRKAGVVTAGATLVVCLALYLIPMTFPLALLKAFIDSVLTGLLVLVVTTLAKGHDERPIRFSALGPLLLVAVTLIALGVWTSLTEPSTVASTLFWLGAKQGVSVMVIVVVLILIGKASGPHRPPSGVRPATAGVVIVAVAAGQTTATGDLADGLVAAVSTGLVLVLVLVPFRRGPAGWRVGTPTDLRDWLTTPKLAGLGFGFVHGVYYFPLYGLAVGLAVALAVELVTRHLAPGNPAQGLRLTRRGFVLGTVVCVVLSVLLVTRGLALADAGLMGAIVGLAVGLAYGMDAPHRITPVRSPRQVLAGDRTAFLVSTAAITIAATVAVGFVAGMGRDFHLASALIGGLLYGTTTGALVAFSRTQWLHYTVNRLTLAARGHLPWALMTFLADAHTVHGVLRQDGASYQFRHIDLQRRLAATHRSAATTARSEVQPTTRAVRRRPQDSGEPLRRSGR
ncbi:hypothetical protein GCM10010492_58480 [Saccharothrix mutabilis subsp. mutabilis]|uniref:NACHT domain-containing protein n=1 Tax=Saccharothrix mutabilis subsp. mutabilis TaxID=66855 RepID=A0ABP3E5B1_9PSEU